MKKIFLVFLLFAGVCSAQDKFVLTPDGFAPVEIERPARSDEKLIEAAKAWNDFYNKKQHDNYDVTANSLRIDAWRDNAFFYRNVGETFTCNITYSLAVTFEQKIEIVFTVKEIYSKKTLLKMKTADMFTPEGVLKEDFGEAKQSLEKTANNILKSFARFVANY